MRDMRAPSSESEGPDNQLRVRTKVWFGVGTIGEAATNWIFNALTFIYYQQILGLGAALAALAVSIAIFADAITDPLIGSIFRPIPIAIWPTASVYVRRAYTPSSLNFFLFLILLKQFLALKNYLFAWLLIFYNLYAKPSDLFFAVQPFCEGEQKLFHRLISKSTQWSWSF
jgi:Na+/melibiose symporter and related transporters